MSLWWVSWSQIGAVTSVPMNCVVIIYIKVCLPVCLSVANMYVCLFTFLSVWHSPISMFIPPFSVCSFICLSIHLSICLSVHSTTFCLSIYSSVCLFIQPYFCLSIQTTVCLFIQSFSVCLLVCLSILSLSVYLFFFCLHAHIIFYLSVCQIISQPLQLTASLSRKT